jgi:hypothetical protein
MQSLKISSLSDELDLQNGTGLFPHLHMQQGHHNLNIARANGQRG